MSSIVDALLTSDNPDVDLAAGPGLLNRIRNSPRKRAPPRSSSRLRGPPSESHGQQSEDEGLPDDEVVGSRGASGRPQPEDRPIPRVVDITGETVQQNFEDFLEQYASSFSLHRFSPFPTWKRIFRCWFE